MAASATMFTLPTPTGRYPVATASFSMSRETYQNEPGRTYDVQIWYPSEPTGSPAAYDPGESGWKQALYRQLIRSHAAAGAPAISGGDALPVVVYVSSWGGGRNENTALAEELASHGYLVAGIGDVLHDTPELHSLSAPLDLSSETAFHDALQITPEKAAYEARRASAVLGRILAPHALAAYGLPGRVDSRRVAIAGYSFGGAVARMAAQQDRRFLASVNLDGWFFPAERTFARDRGIPYLYISTKDAPPRAEDLSAIDLVRRHTALLNRADLPVQMRQLMHDGTLIEIAGTEHVSFSDVPLYSVSMRLKHRRDPVHIARLIGSYTTAFLDETLKGRRTAMLDLGSQRDPAVTLRRWRDGRSTSIAAQHSGRT
jgi:dienelactone hydrolase